MVKTTTTESENERLRHLFNKTEEKKKVTTFPDEFVKTIAVCLI